LLWLVSNKKKPVISGPAASLLQAHQMTCSQGIARSQINFIYEIKIVHKIDKINLFRPFFAKASATFLFLPPTAIHDMVLVQAKLCCKEN
jgi:hypothetical protein